MGTRQSPSITATGRERGNWEKYFNAETGRGVQDQMVVAYLMIRCAFLALGVMTRSPEYLRAFNESPLVQYISVSGKKKA